MTGESNPEERPVDSNTGDGESESPVLLDSESSEMVSGGDDSADSSEASQPSTSKQNGDGQSDSQASDSSESGRLGSLDPTVKVKRPEHNQLLDEAKEKPTKSESESDESLEAAHSEHKTSEDGGGSDTEHPKRVRRSAAKGPIPAGQRRQTPGGPRDQRRPRGRDVHASSHGSPSHDMMASVLQSLQQLTTRTTHLESNTQKIARALVEIVKEGDNRKRAYDVLYDEMRQYKENFLWQCQKPLFMDLITLFDSILRVERQYESTEGMEKVAGDFRYLKDELLETLYRYDVELIEEHPDRLDIGFQKPIKRVDTDDPSEDRAVVKIVREGFGREGMILRPQEIVVKRYSESKEG